MRICVPRAAAARADLMTPSNFSVMALGRAGARTTSFHLGADLQRYFSPGIIPRLVDGISHASVQNLHGGLGGIFSYLSEVVPKLTIL